MKQVVLAIRALRKQPGFAIAATATLAIGIAVTTALFTVINTVVLKPLPFADQSRLVRIWSNFPERQLKYFSVSRPDYEDWRSQSRAFEQMAAYERERDATLSGGAEPLRISMSRVTPELFRLLGTIPVRGRLFTAEETAANTRGVVIGHGFWQRQFGADDSALGRSIVIDGESYAVVGVMPSGFGIANNASELWVPLMFQPSENDRNNRWLRVLARLRPGVTVAEGRADLITLASRIYSATGSSTTGWSVTVEPLFDTVVGTTFRQALWVLLGVVASVLAIACANVAALLFDRATGRRRELAVRAALGAGRTRLIIEGLTEGLLLSIVGGGLGILLALWIVDVLRTWGSGSVPRLDEVRLEPLVVALAALLSIAAGFVSGVAPAWQASRVNLIVWLREGTAGATASARTLRWRDALVVAEITLALVLLAGAGLVVKSFLRAQEVNLGFRTERVVAMSLALPRATYGEPTKSIAFYQDLVDRTRALPDVEAAGATSSPPFGGPNSALSFAVEGIDFDPNAPPDADYRIVSAGYFGAMGIPLIAGRTFAPEDRIGSAPAMLIGESLARRHFAGRSPLGARVRIGDVVRGPWRTVVGVVGDVRHYGWDTPTVRPVFYLPMTQSPALTMTLVARARADMSAVGPQLRDVVRTLDAGLPIVRLRTTEEMVGLAFATQRFNTALFATFALLALVLACVGLAGTIAYGVSQRMRELAVRFALGAHPRGLVRLVVARGVMLALAGVGLGLAISLPMARVLEGLLYRVEPRDPWTFATVSCALVAVAALASYVPARRVSALDPVGALRGD